MTSWPTECLAFNGRYNPAKIDRKSDMTQQAAALQTYNNELVKCIEELCSKRDELNRQIKQEEEEKERLQHDIRVLSEKLSRVNESLTQRLAARATFDRTIAETEAAYTKILESSQSLLSVLKQEAGNLSKATEPRRTEH